jgi:site-specific DNA recombinase
MFELYSRGNMTFDVLSDQLQREGFVYRASAPRFYRTTLSYILNNRFYIGEILWHGRVFKGKHRPIVDVATFQACQDVLKGKNKRKRQANLPFAGGAFRCKYCGQAITGELIRKRLSDGSVRQHVYYRCGNDERSADHPKVRWKAEALEEAIVAELRKLKLPSVEVTEWFRDELKDSLSDEVEFNKRKQTQLRKRESELQSKRDRLLEVFLSGAVDSKHTNRKRQKSRWNWSVFRQRLELKRD